MKKQITDEQIEAIKDFIKNRNTLQVRKVLNELEEPKDILRDELNNFLRNKGRSTIFKSEIYSILDNTKRREKMEETQTEEKQEETEEEKTEEVNPDTTNSEVESTEETEEDSE